MAKKKKQPKKKITKKVVGKALKDLVDAIKVSQSDMIPTEMLLHANPHMVSTKCTNCNLRLVIPEVESHRCVLCGCKELTKHAWSRT